MTEENIKTIVHKYIKSGLNCAEAIVSTMEEITDCKTNNLCKYVGGFGGGVGKSRKEMCGAISGAIVFIGSVYGRDNKNGSNELSLKLAHDLREEFENEFGCTRCETVKSNILQKPEYHGCKDVTAKTAWILYSLLKNKKY